MVFKSHMSLFAALLCTALSAGAVQAGTEEGLAALEQGDVETAVAEFRKGQEAGEGDASFYLARMIELGAQPSWPEVIALLEEGSEAGSAMAKNRLGLLYLEGLYTLQDYEEGARLICEAAEMGDPNGEFNCALALLDGQGVEADEGRAMAYVQSAAGKGQIAAKNLLGQSYITGTGVDEDEEKAIQQFQQTAAVGNPVGLFSLAQAYALGIGLDRDLVKAHAYFNLAASRGHPDAVQARQEVEAELTKDQITEAQRFARGWRPEGAEQDAAEQAEEN